MKTLKDASEHELEQELERKRKKREAEEKPKPLPQMHMGKLIDCCQSYIDSVDKGEAHDDDDHAHYIYEEAMKAIFGSKIFDWINKKQR